MTDRIRLALLALVVLACLALRAGGALAAVKHPGVHRRLIHRVSHRVPRRAIHRVSPATQIAREQARVVRFARRYVGVRYSYGGTSPRTGFDCSGFTRFVYAHFGIRLPHYSVAQFDRGRRVSRAGLRPGDLVFFDDLGHVGVYVGGGRFIHAPHTGTRVQISSLGGWYSSEFDGARRLV